MSGAPPPPPSPGGGVLAHRDAMLRDARSGAPVALGSLWAERPVVLGFLRRLGWQMCRITAQDLEALREEAAPLGADVACLSFEMFGEGSDADRSFERGGFFKGRVLVADRALYSALFPRRTTLSGLYGLATKGMAKLSESYRRGTDKGANLLGDGLVLGGSFVVDAEHAGGAVLFEKRQAFFGDDATNDELLAALKKAKGFRPLPPPPQQQPAAAAEAAAAEAAPK